MMDQRKRIDRIEERVEDWKGTISRLEHRASRAGHAARRQTIDGMAEVRQRIDELRDEVARIKGASGDAFYTIHGRAGEAVQRVRNTIDGTVDRIVAAPPTFRHELVRIGEDADALLQELEPQFESEPGSATEPASISEHEAAPIPELDTGPEPETPGRKPGRLQDPSAGRIQHVVPHGGEWAVRAEGAERVSFVFKTKEEAVEKGRQIGRNQKSGLVVHRANGTIQEHHRYRDD